MALDHGESETRFARDRILDLLEELEFTVATDWVSPEDGWRAELRSGDGRGVVLRAHKPQGAPYATLELETGDPAPGDAAGYEALLAITSDYDVAVFPGEDGTLRLAARIFISALNREDVHFHVKNMLFCRDALAEERSA